MVELRDCVHRLIDQQLDEYTPDETILSTQRELNRLYDAFSSKYTANSMTGQRQVFSDDASYYLLCSRKYWMKTRNWAQGRYVTRRTIRAQRVPLRWTLPAKLWPYPLRRKPVSIWNT